VCWECKYEKVKKFAFEGKKINAFVREPDSVNTYTVTMCVCELSESKHISQIS